jgi:hypothetical protein
LSFQAAEITRRGSGLKGCGYSAVTVRGFDGA